MLRKLLLVGVAALMATPVWAETYHIDRSHSTLTFSVKHMMLAKTKGQFGTFYGTIDYDAADLSKFKADVTVDVNSIDTQNGNRDEHLKSPDFLDAKNFQYITFNNATLVKTETGGLAIVGDLNMKANIRKITIPVELSGPVKNMTGKQDVIGISGHVTINRQDFGMSFNKVMETGGLIVDNMVDIAIEIEAQTKREVPTPAEVKTPVAAVEKKEAAKPVKTPDVVQPVADVVQPVSTEVAPVADQPAVTDATAPEAQPAQ